MKMWRRLESDPVFIGKWIVGWGGALLLLILMMCAMTAHAGDATVSWVAPTENTDLTPIPATGDAALKQYNVEYGTCNTAKTGFTGTISSVIVPAPALQTTITGFGLGTFCFRVSAINNVMVASVPSAVANKAFVAPTPKPPTGVVITATTAFMAVRKKDAWVMLPVGTVPANTPCDTNFGTIANGVTYYAVPRASVEWYGSTQPEIVMASCS